MYLIEKRKNERTFFITLYEERISLTWMKTSALLFQDEEDAKQFVVENRLEYCIVKNIEQAKNH